MLAVPVPGSKSAVPTKRPDTWTLPAASTATPCGRFELAPDPIKPLAHTRAPDALSFHTNVLKLLGAVSGVVPGPGSKSTVPKNSPTTTTAPEGASATAVAVSAALPPADTAHRKLPELSSFTTKGSVM